MQTKIVRLKEVVPADYNPRVQLKPKDHEYKALNASIDEFGLVVPLIVNERTGNLVSGHQRLNVMLERGVEETEVVIVDMPLEKEKALCIAMNKVSGLWDYGKLADILEELSDEGIDTLITGFPKTEIAELLGEVQEAEEELNVEVPFTPKKEDTQDGVKCLVGIYRFRISDQQYQDAMADIRLKVGFSSLKVTEELERRLFIHEVSDSENQ